MTTDKLAGPVLKESDAAKRRIQELISYDPKSGGFVWKADVGRWNRIKAGTSAGSLSHGYVIIRLNGVHYPAHRIAWLLVHGVWPTEEIDHINGDRADNRLLNIRDVPKKWNGHNRQCANKDNTSCGLLGSTRNGKSGWMAQITVNGKRIYLGTFSRADIAHHVYLAAKRQLHAGCTI